MWFVLFFESTTSTFSMITSKLNRSVDIRTLQPKTLGIFTPRSWYLQMARAFSLMLSLVWGNLSFASFSNDALRINIGKTVAATMDAVTPRTLGKEVKAYFCVVRFGMNALMKIENLFPSPDPVPCRTDLARPRKDSKKYFLSRIYRRLSGITLKSACV